jgi:hypothetical protein
MGAVAAEFDEIYTYAISMGLAAGYGGTQRGALGHR